jgi:hypothetical protein
MYYWNQANFEGLREIGDALQAVPGLHRFAGYCLLREQGLRKQAMAELLAFVADTSAWPLAEQRTLACRLTQLHFDNRGVHQLVAEPLRAYLQGVFASWCAEHPDLAEPYRWLGVLSSEPHHFEAALNFAPNDRIALGWLASHALNAVDFATHHLGESRLLGSLEEAYAWLERATGYAARLQPEEACAQFLEEIAGYRELLDAWREYQTLAPAQLFLEWSREQGFGFEFPAAFYYDE